MTIIWKSIVAAVVAVGFLFVVGYLEIRAEMVDAGLTLTWDLEPLQVTTQNVAVLELSLIFVVFGVLAFLFLTRRRGLSGGSGIPALAGGLTLVALAAWHMATVDHSLLLPMELNEPGEEFGWAKVFETGGLSSTTHSMAALLLVIAVLKMTQAGSYQRLTAAEPANTGSHAAPQIKEP